MPHQPNISPELQRDLENYSNLSPSEKARVSREIQEATGQSPKLVNEQLRAGINPFTGVTIGSEPSLAPSRTLGPGGEFSNFSLDPHVAAQARLDAAAQQFTPGQFAESGRAAEAAGDAIIGGEEAQLAGVATNEFLTEAGFADVASTNEALAGERATLGRLTTIGAGRNADTNLADARALEATSGATGRGIIEGAQARQTEGLGILSGLGERERADVNQRFDARAGQIQQNVSRRGFAGSTVGANLLAGSNVRRDAELARLNDRLARERFDAFSDLSGTVLDTETGQQEVSTRVGGDANRIGRVGRDRALQAFSLAGEGNLAERERGFIRRTNQRGRTVSNPVPLSATGVPIVQENFRLSTAR